MSHFVSRPPPQDKAIQDYVSTQMGAAMKAFQRRYFFLPWKYIALYNDPTLPAEETARLADEWAESEFKKESQA